MRWLHRDEVPEEEALGVLHLEPWHDRNGGRNWPFTFVLPELDPGGIRELRNPDAADEDDD